VSRSLVNAWMTLIVFAVLAIAAVLLASAVIDGLASGSPSVTISIVSPSPS
jgi:hypothetical protein